MRWRWLTVAAVTLITSCVGTVLAVAVNVATLRTAPWFSPVEHHPLWWVLGATTVSALAGLADWTAARRYERSLTELVPPVQPRKAGVIDRPAEVTRIVTALRPRGGRAVAISAAVYGAGGFGKTTIARQVRDDPRIRRCFRGRVYWLTVGRDTGREKFPGLVNDLLTRIDPGRAAAFTSVQPAAEHLAAVLDRGPRRLVIVDDVWTEEQLAAFPIARRSARLITTRRWSLATEAGTRVKVGEMTSRQALEVLQAGLPLLPATVVNGLAEATWRWPLLLRIVNQILASHARLQRDVPQAAESLLDRLRTGGAVQADQLAEAAGGQPRNVSDPDERARTVGATLEASTSLLNAAGQVRLAELAVFAGGEAIPVSLAARLWHVTGGLDPMPGS